MGSFLTTTSIYTPKSRKMPSWIKNLKDATVKSVVFQDMTSLYVSGSFPQKNLHYRCMQQLMSGKYHALIPCQTLDALFIFFISGQGRLSQETSSKSYSSLPMTHFLWKKSDFGYINDGLKTKYVDDKVY